MRIGIVDNHFETAEYIRAALRLFVPDAIIKIYHSGERLMEDLEKGDMMDLIFLDHKLDNGKTGPEYMENIARHNIPVVGISLDDQNQPDFLQHGARAFILKDSAPERYKEEVYKILY